MTVLLLFYTNTHVVLIILLCYWLGNFQHKCVCVCVFLGLFNNMAMLKLFCPTYIKQCCTKVKRRCSKSDQLKRPHRNPRKVLATNPIKIIFFNLAICNLLIVLLCIPITVMRVVLLHWSLGNFWCRILNYLQVIMFIICKTVHFENRQHMQHV